jgi:pimeloyl-ACP methyl ester carboxylesterase
MHAAPRRPGRPAVLLCAVLAVLLVAAPAAGAQSAPPLDWQACGQPPDVQPGAVQCAMQTVPLDYDRPNGRTIQIAVARVPAKDQAHRIGSLLINFGGPGAPAVDFLQTTAGQGFLDTLNRRFDILAFDPRGTGQSSPSIDCKANQERLGLYAQPFPTPSALHLRALLKNDRAYFARCLSLVPRSILAHVSTADVARDMESLRQAVGDAKLTYLGFSYGTFLGATYAALFPRGFRALVLDGPVDADAFINDPVANTDEQTAAIERAFGRFFAACAANQTACARFGGRDPWDAYDLLVARAQETRLPARRYTPDPRPVDGDDINAAAVSAMYNKQFWPALALGLRRAALGDGSIIRLLVDELSYMRDPDTGEYDPLSDAFVAIDGGEAKWPTRVRAYVREGEQAWRMFDHAYFNQGYTELGFGLWPVRAQDAYFGPFHVDASAPAPLVVDTTYDPATPYRGGLMLARELGHARVLTMRGDGHTAYGQNSPCINRAVNAYLIDGTLPPAGTSCRQRVPFAQPSGRVAASSVAPDAAAVRRALRSLLRYKPLVR